MTHLSLCSGIGGIDIAAEWSGFETIAVCEIDALCRKVLAHHFPNAYQFHDIAHVTAQSLQHAGLDSPTLISAGFPCQPFSIAGKREGTDDSRNLWPEVARILRDVKPRWFLGENVRGILSIDDGRTFGAILADLAQLGYRVGWSCFGADEAAGAPHYRDRVFILGYLENAVSGRHRGRSDGNASRRECQIQAERSRSKLANARRQRYERLRLYLQQKAQDAEASRSGPSMADAASMGRPEGGCIALGDTSPQPKPENDRGLLADHDSQRQQDRLLRRGTKPPIAAPLDDHSHLAPFPPGPAALEQWSRILYYRPDLAPGLTPDEEIELQILPLVDGISRRMALKMAGNAVSPHQVLPILQEIANFELTQTHASNDVNN